MESRFRRRTKCSRMSESARSTTHPEVLSGPRRPGICDVRRYASASRGSRSSPQPAIIVRPGLVVRRLLTQPLLDGKSFGCSFTNGLAWPGTGYEVGSDVDPGPVPSPDHQGRSDRIFASDHDIGENQVTSFRGSVSLFRSDRRFRDHPDTRLRFTIPLIPIWPWRECRVSIVSAVEQNPRRRGSTDSDFTGLTARFRCLLFGIWLHEYERSILENRVSRARNATTGSRETAWLSYSPMVRSTE